MVELHGIVVISFRVIIYKCLFANFFLLSLYFKMFFRIQKGSGQFFHSEF